MNSGSSRSDQVHGELRALLWVTASACWMAPVILGIVFELWLSPLPSLFLGLYSVSFAPIPIVRVVVIAVVTALGVFSSLLLDAINTSRTDRPRLRSLFRTALGSRRAWSAAVVSPFVFYAVYTTTRNQPDTVEALFFAYQNGFFWDAILSRAIEAGRRGRSIENELKKSDPR